MNFGYFLWVELDLGSDHFIRVGLRFVSEAIWRNLSSSCLASCLRYWCQLHEQDSWVEGEPGVDSKSGLHRWFLFGERLPKGAILKIPSILSLSGDFKMAWQLLRFLETLLYDKKWLVFEISFWDVLPLSKRMWICGALQGQFLLWPKSSDLEGRIQISSLFYSFFPQMSIEHF